MRTIKNKWAFIITGIIIALGIATVIFANLEDGNNELSEQAIIQHFYNGPYYDPNKKNHNNEAYYNVGYLLCKQEPTGKYAIVSRHKHKLVKIGTTDSFLDGINADALRFLESQQGKYKFVNASGSYDILGCKTLKRIHRPRAMAGDYYARMMESNISSTPIICYNPQGSTEMEAYTYRIFYLEKEKEKNTEKQKVYLLETKDKSVYFTDNCIRAQVVEP